MHPIIVGLIGFHVHLFALALWYTVLLFRWTDDLPIPGYVKDLFDVHNGEPMAFCCSIIFLLNAAGFYGEAAILIIHRYSNLIVLPFLFGGVISTICMVFFVIGWRVTVSKNL